MDNPFDIIETRLSSIESLLLNLKRSPGNENSENQTEQLFTVKEAAQFLKLSVPTIYALVSRAEIPYMKKGKRLYFSNLQLIDWLKTGRRKTLSETAKEAEQYLTRKNKGGSHE